MKSLTALLLPVVVSGATINNEARQLPDLGKLLGGLSGSASAPAGGAGGSGNLFSQMFQSASLKVANVTDLTPKVKPAAKRQLIKWGPLTLLGYNAQKPLGSFSMDPHGQTFISTLSDAVPKDSAIIGGELGLAFEDGTKTTMEKGIYVHHMLTMDTSKSETRWVSMCGTNDTSTTAAAPASPFDALGSSSSSRTVSNSPGGAGFLGIGEDNGDSWQYFTTPDGSFNSGFKMGAADTFGVQSDIVNYNNETKKVFITMDLEYLPNDQVQHDAKIVLMSVTGCMARKINLDPSGVAITTSAKFPIFENGYIVHAKGHMHDGGDQMILSLNDKPICNSKATYGGAGATMTMGSGKAWATISDMTACGYAVAVKKGDYLTLTSVYDTKAHPLRQSNGNDMEVMGMYGVSFSPVGAGAGAPAVAADPPAVDGPPTSPANSSSEDAPYTAPARSPNVDVPHKAPTPL